MLSVSSGWQFKNKYMKKSTNEKETGAEIKNRAAVERRIQEYVLKYSAASVARMTIPLLLQEERKTEDGKRLVWGKMIWTRSGALALGWAMDRAAKEEKPRRRRIITAGRNPTTKDALGGVVLWVSWGDASAIGQPAEKISVD